MSTTRRKYLFVDRDGTLIREPSDQQVDRFDKLALMPGVVAALQRLTRAGWRLVLVSNQDGLGTDSFPRADFEGPHRLLMDILASQGIDFADERICPHWPGDGCDCRKPKPGLLMDYLRDTGWDRAASAVIGDRNTDLELAGAMGLRGLLVGDGGLDWPGVAAELIQGARRGTASRRTKETGIRVAVDLDEDRSISVNTGIGFFDHMLEQIAAHGGFGLKLEVAGDLHVDEHHTMEDTALSLGAALDQALGDRFGLARFGFFLPMDETRAQVALDLSGRPYCRFTADFPRERVGELPTEMVGHFFQSLSQALRATLHVEVEGENAHHMVESAFKATGRALRQAIRRETEAMPSTKGAL